MTFFIELLKSALLGVVQGIAEWLPISSTGHMILLDELLSLDVSDAFMELFLVFVQLGSIMAVVVLYFSRLNPFSRKKTAEGRRSTWLLWAKIAVASIPAAIVGILFDDWIDEHFFNSAVVAGALIVYGVVMILLERSRSRSGDAPETADAESIGFLTAFKIGCFQMLSLIPGTSRSGSTIIGASLCRVSRTAAAEFSFFMAIPVMAGASLLKLLKFGLSFTGAEAALLAVGTVVAFGVSLAAIRFLVGFVRTHSFAPFGVYRIALGVIVLARFAF